LNILKVLQFVLESDLLSSSQKNDYFNKCQLTYVQSCELLTEVIKKRTAIVELSKEYKKFDCPHFSTLLMLNNYKFQNQFISDENFDCLLDYLKINKKKRKQVIANLAPCLGKIEQIEALKSAGYLNTSERVKFHILRRCLELSEFDYFNRIRGELINDEVLNKKLTLLLGHYSKTNKTKDVENVFNQLNGDYFCDYFQKLIRFWHDLPEVRNYIELRSDLDKQSLLKSMIENRLSASQSFSFIRLSDGEAYWLSDDKLFNERQERHWWGKVLPEELRSEIKKDFNFYIRNSSVDMVGFPTCHKFVHYVGYKNTGFNTESELGTNVLNRLAFMVNAVPQILEYKSFQNAIVCEDQINNYLFDLDYFFQLAKHAKRLVLVSGYNEQALQNALKELNLTVHIIEIPTHNLLRMRNDTVDSNITLPYLYKDVLHTLQSIVLPGDLCLISAGFIGKMFIAECANRGAVAIDVGQTLGRIINEK